jgi:hypothetical protein
MMKLKQELFILLECQPVFHENYYFLSLDNFEYPVHTEDAISFSGTGNIVQIIKKREVDPASLSFDHFLTAHDRTEEDELYSYIDLEDFSGKITLQRIKNPHNGEDLYVMIQDEEMVYPLAFNSRPYYFTIPSAELEQAWEEGKKFADQSPEFERNVQLSYLDPLNTVGIRKEFPIPENKELKDLIRSNDVIRATQGSYQEYRQSNLEYSADLAMTLLVMQRLGQEGFAFSRMNEGLDDQIPPIMAQNSTGYDDFLSKKFVSNSVITDLAMLVSTGFKLPKGKLRKPLFENQELGLGWLISPKKYAEFCHRFENFIKK